MPMGSTFIYKYIVHKLIPNWLTVIGKKYCKIPWDDHKM